MAAITIVSQYIDNEDTIITVFSNNVTKYIYTSGRVITIDENRTRTVITNDSTTIYYVDGTVTIMDNDGYTVKTPRGTIRSMDARGNKKKRSAYHFDLGK